MEVLLTYMNYSWREIRTYKISFQSFSLMELIRTGKEGFWSPAIWLPPNITWEQFDHNKDFAQFYDLKYPFPMALILMLVRYLVERTVFRPLGKQLNLEDKRSKKPARNLILENAYQKKIKDYRMLSIKTDLTERQVEKWMRDESQADKYTKCIFTPTAWPIEYH